jgi:adenylate cyclase
MRSNKKYFDLLAIFLIFLLAAVFEYKEAFSLLEDETLSYRQLLRAYNADPAVTAPSEDVVIVYTDEAFYEDYDKYPLTRVDLATLVARLAQMDAKVIGVDMLLDFNSAYGEDPTLANAFAEAGNVVLVSQAQIGNAGYESMNLAIPRFASITAHGYSNIAANSAISESIVRLRIHKDIAALGEWPFAVKAVSMFVDSEPELEDAVLTIGDRVAPVDQFSDLYIDFPRLPSDGEGGTARLYDVIGISASDILFVQDEEELYELSYLVAGKIVLIGEVAEVAHDEFETPVGNVYGVSIIANTIGTILKNAPLRAAPLWLEGLALLLLLAALSASHFIDNPLPRNLASLGIVSLFLLVTTGTYIHLGLVMSVSYGFLACLLVIIFTNARFYLAEMGQKALIKDAFGQYLSPKVVADLVKDPSKLALGGEEREMTAFFSDIAGFSSFSEKMTPTELVHALNDYLTEMCRIIVEYEGTVDKFEGDAIIAFWGAPSIQLDHATLACYASIDMQKSIVEIDKRFVAEGRPKIAVRMGLNTGRMVVGNMGSAQRMDYTIMGDAVNLASRLEGANKAYGSDIMISGMTYAAVKDNVDVRELDTLRVVGKNEPITVYQLLERKGQTPAHIAELVAQFERALALYKARNYVEAKAGFEQCQLLIPEDGPSRIYARRCELYMTTPPADDWDGVFNLTEKG